MPFIIGAVVVVGVVFLFSKFADHRLQKGEIQESNRLVGQPAPDFVGDFAVNGKLVKLSDLKGKVVLVDFWAVWCPPCIAAFPHLREWNKEYKQDGLEIVGLTMYNQPDKHAEQAMLTGFSAQHKLDHLLMTLPEPDFARTSAAYGIKYFPTVILVDRKGIVRMVSIGGEPEKATAIEREIKKLMAERG